MDKFSGGELKVSMQTGERLGGVAAAAEDPSSDDVGMAARTETMSTEWTDEKHSMYLKSMEASFVNQLYNSMDSRGRNSQKGNSSHPKLSSQKQPQFNSRAPSGRFKILRGGCWQKINFVRAEAEAKADEDLLANPWFLHFRSAGKPKEFESPIVQELDASLCEEVDSSRKKEMTGAPATCSKQFHASHSQLRHQDMVGSNTGALSYTLRSRIRISSMKILKKRQLVHATVRGRRFLYLIPQVTIRLFHSASLPVPDDVTRNSILLLQLEERRPCERKWMHWTIIL